MTTCNLPRFLSYYWVPPGKYETHACDTCSPCHGVPQFFEPDVFLAGRSLDGPLDPGIASSDPMYLLLWINGPLEKKCRGFQVWVDTSVVMRVDLCAWCGKCFKNAHVCTRCITHSYCSDECELKHRPLHKEWCFPPCMGTLPLPTLGKSQPRRRRRPHK